MILSDKSHNVLVCMKDGKFLGEESDGGATWTFWTDNILFAKIFKPCIIYSEEGSPAEVPEKPPAYYQCWPEIKPGARMVLARVQAMVHEVASGPTQTPTSQQETYPNR